MAALESFRRSELERRIEEMIALLDLLDEDPDIEDGHDDEVIVEALNPPQTLILMASMLLGIHKCLGPLPAGAATTKVSDEWIRQQADKRQQNR